MRCFGAVVFGPAIRTPGLHLDRAQPEAMAVPILNGLDLIMRTLNLLDVAYLRFFLAPALLLVTSIGSGIFHF